MAEITASLVKELREITGAGMMECKKILAEVGGNIEAAVEAMRKAGIAKAAKKAGRIAAEGIIVTQLSHDKKFGAIIETNCETDFVARDENFKNFAKAVAQCVLRTRITDVAQLSQLPLSTEQNTSVEQARLELVTKIGENVQIRRIELVQAVGEVGEYIHSGRIGVLVALTQPNSELAKDIAMHVAASNPQAIKPADVSADLIAKEKEIFSAQAATSGKPADIIEKMVQGRINKFLSEVSLEGQPFVKNPETTVGSLLRSANNEVSQFIRFEVGEGIDKPIEDFAEVVKATAGGV